MKTFEHCCDEAARKNEINYFTDPQTSQEIVNKIYKEAADLYASELTKEKVTEAVKLARLQEVISPSNRFNLYTLEEILQKLGL